MDSTISVAKAQHIKRNQLQMLSESRSSGLAIANYRRKDHAKGGVRSVIDMALPESSLLKSPIRTESP